MYLIGYDIGSSSIKAALYNADDHTAVGVVQSPETEMEIQAPQLGWAEQEPETWWQHICKATQKLLQQTKVDPQDIKGIGIAYQMHGLVLVDQDHKALRPSIIWCDSRAVPIGEKAFEGMGQEVCLSHFLNAPGNFTASKLKWVHTHQPEVYEKAAYFMLPGDFIAMKLTGEVNTTISGLSEGILWDFKAEQPAQSLLDFYGLDKKLIPPIRPTFSIQGELTTAAAEATGLKVGTPVAYRAGDQPNNALSLNVFNPGEVAATGGTSGVVYGIVDQAVYDRQSRVNGFAHVNHTQEDPRIGVLLCINGAGSQYRWVKQQMAVDGISYGQMEEMLTQIAIGSDNVQIIPFGNGAERMLENRNVGGHIAGLDFNRHSRAHCFRAALEGIAFSFVYGMNILKDMGLDVAIMRVGNDNLFQSPVFGNTISTLMGTTIEVIDTTGAVGAAKAAGLGTGIYQDLKEALGKTQKVKEYQPNPDKKEYQAAYELWDQALQRLLKVD